VEAKMSAAEIAELVFLVTSLVVMVDETDV
jgi:hypothetical protein